MIRKPIMLYSLTLLLLVMFAVAAAGINADSIWHDEYLSLFYAGAMSKVPTTPLDTIARLTERAAGQAPLYYVLLSIWGELAGWSVFSTRILSLFVGVLAIAWIYRAGAGLHSTYAGLCAATILAASAFFNVYLHEIRMYSLVVLLIAIIPWLYLQVLNTKRSPMWNAFFVVVITATLYTHPFMTVVIASLGLYHLIFAQRTQSWSVVLLLFVICGILFSPWAWLILAKISSKRVPSDFDFLRTNGEILVDLAKAASNGFWIFLLLPLSSLRLLKADRTIRLLWWLGLTSIAALLFVNHRQQAINQLRYFLYILPLIALLGGIACAQAIRNRKFVGVILVAWCISGIVVAPTFGNLLYIPSEFIMLHVTFPFKEVTNKILLEAGENDAIVFDFPYHNWAVHSVIEYYMRGTSIRYLLTETLGESVEGQARTNMFRHFLGAAGKVFFVSDLTVSRSEYYAEYEQILSDRYVQCGQLWDSDQARVDKHARIEALCQPPEQVLVEYNSSVTLLEFVHHRTETAHEFISTWSTELPRNKYSFSLRFWDEEGALLQQVDNALPIGDFDYRIDRLQRRQLPDDATIKIDAVIYDWRTGERLQTSSGSDILYLATIKT